MFALPCLSIDTLHRTPQFCLTQPHSCTSFPCMRHVLFLRKSFSQAVSSAPNIGPFFLFLDLYSVPHVERYPRYIYSFLQKNKILI